MHAKTLSPTHKTETCTHAHTYVCTLYTTTYAKTDRQIRIHTPHHTHNHTYWIQTHHQYSTLQCTYVHTLCSTVLVMHFTTSDWPSVAITGSGRAHAELVLAIQEHTIKHSHESVAIHTANHNCTQDSDKAAGWAKRRYM